MNNPKTEASSSGQRQQAQRQQGGAAADPAVPRSSSGMQMSDEVPKPQDSHDPTHFALHGRQFGGGGGDAMEGLSSSGTLAAEGLPLSMAHKIRKDVNDNGLLRPYPLAAGVVQAAGGSSVGSTPMGSEAPTVSDDSQAEGDLHPFAAKIAEVKQQRQKQKQKEKGKQQQQARTAAGHHAAPHITAAALPSKVFNGEAWLLDPYGTGNNPLSSPDPRLRGTASGAAAASKGRTVGRDAGKGKQTEKDSGGLDMYGEMDTSHAGRASLASDGEIELPAQHEVVQDRLGSPGADDLGI
ncbi:hypothetical protein PG996_015171 [Apiospora saccharicola]|uniref:Mediator of RNA polymerase II transcription subunit 19 n=1 Tax=Apiospora saccharicola TaxID=335842 RepID=A0ABR1TL51_9PEZI